MKDVKETKEAGVLQTESGRYLINGSDRIFARTSVTWEDIFRAIDQAEEEWREWLYEGLLTPFYEHMTDPLCNSKKSSADSSSELTFKLKSEYAGQQKLRFISRQFIFFDWMNRNGYIPPLVSREAERKRFPKGYDALETLDLISDIETTEMWKSILIDKDTRVSLTDGYIDANLEYDLEHIRNLGREKLNTSDPLDFLNQLFSDGISEIVGCKLSRLRKFSKLRFLSHFASEHKILLSAPKLAESAKALSRIFPGFTKRYAVRKLSGKRSLEIIAGAKYLAEAHKGARQLRTVDFLVLFAAGNYGSSSAFAPEYLLLAQTATSGEKNNFRPYFQGIREFHNLTADETREWDGKLRGRNSAVMRGLPFALFREPADLVKAAQPVQVSNYEKKSGLKFPSTFDQGIIDWTYTLEKFIRKLPRNDAAQPFTSATLFLTYLCTLPLAKRPRSFAEVTRDCHIKSDDKTRSTYVAFITSNGLEARERLRDLHQLMELWQREQKERIHLPIDPKIDWTNRQKSFRTKRKAIPTIIVETLIQENSRECPDGIPYARYRKWINDTQSSSSILTFDGLRADATIPSVPAVIDCILHLGMRSSSARWLDSGQADEFEVNYQTLNETPNPSPHATPGVRNGFHQRVQVSPDQWVNSFLMLRNKTLAIHEIPYAPDELIKRLLYICGLQQSYNGLENPIRAVEEESTTNYLDEFPLVYPLFRDPSNASSKPVSYSKVTRWWAELLKQCEPIVNKKRKKHYGADCDYYDFFDSSGKPIWDIHSIRVTVITALLDMGVSPTIVQHLVGHKNFMMTLHYHAVDSSQINIAIAQALEKRRLAAANAIASARNEAELDDAMETVMGGFASRVSGSGIEDATTFAFANGKNLKSGPGAFSVFSHGICPGGDCGQGGKKRGSSHLPVHRDKACSRCRFRITGPAFLAGLEMNANILMNEIAESTRKEEQLNAELLEFTRVGKPAAVIESRLEQERVYRDEVWADWAAEYQTIKECLELAKTGNNSDSLPALPDKISVHFSEKGRLPLLQDIIGKSKVIAGGSFDLPEGFEEIRNEMLWEIAIKSGDVSQHLISLRNDERRAAIHKFGEMVCSHFDEFGEDSEALFSDETKMLQIAHISAENVMNKAGGK